MAFRRKTQIAGGVVFGIVVLVIAVGCKPRENAPTSKESASSQARPIDRGTPLVAVVNAVSCENRTALAPKTKGPSCLCQSSDGSLDTPDLPAEAKARIEAARVYLEARHLLPRKWMLCASQHDDDAWHVTCWPQGGAINSPVTVTFEDDRPHRHYYSDYNDAALGTAEQ